MANEGNIVRLVQNAEEPPAPDDAEKKGGREPPDETELELARFLRNDYGNGQRLIARHGDDLLFVRGIGWHAFVGTHWSRDEGEDLAVISAHETAKKIFDEAKALEMEGPREGEAEDDFEDRVAPHRKWAVGSGNQTRIGAMLKQAQPYRTLTTDEMDADRFRFNVANGTLILGDEVALAAHDRADRITRLSPATFDPHAECPTFRKFLDRVVPDTSVQVFLQRYFGYSLTGSVAEQCLLLLQGQGRNGKSTLIELMAWIFGDYSMTLPIESLLQDDRRRGSEASPDLARLPGVRLAVASEPNVGARLDEGRVKHLTGGERMTVRHLNRDFFDFDPQFKLCVSFNNAPQVRGLDDGIWRRLRLVPFDVQIPPNEVDKNLLKKLKAEANGILNFLLDGFRLWHESGLAEPASVLKATADYREESDRVGQFLTAATIADPEASIRAKALYVAYCAWCRDNALEPMSGTAFGKQVARKGFEREKVGVMFYKGLRLIDEKMGQDEGDGPPPPAGEGDYAGL